MSEVTSGNPGIYHEKVHIKHAEIVCSLPVFCDMAGERDPSLPRK